MNDESKPKEQQADKIKEDTVTLSSRLLRKRV
jgi:hypothetical protein